MQHLEPEFLASLDQLSIDILKLWIFSAVVVIGNLIFLAKYREWDNQD